MAAIGGLTERHVASRGATIVINRHIARSRSDGHDPSNLGDAWTHLERPISIKSRSPSDGRDDSRKNSTIAVRSNRDRGSFITESSPRSSNGVYWRIKITIMARSRRDRGPIVVLFEAKFKPIHRGFEAIMPFNGN